MSKKHNSHIWIIFLYIYIYLLGYIHYGGEFIVTIPIRLILYTSYIAPIIAPLSSPLLPHLKQLQEVS
jgi:hypothetical protein